MAWSSSMRGFWIRFFARGAWWKVPVVAACTVVGLLARLEVIEYGWPTAVAVGLLFGVVGGWAWVDLIRGWRADRSR